MRYESSIPLQRGVVVEKEMFGKTVEDKVMPAEYRGRYRSYNESLEIAKKRQPGDPTNPQAAFGRDLRIELIDSLEIQMDRYSDVRFYTAVGSELDYYHGIDAFIEIDYNNATHVVTLDVTTRDHKETWKADVLIHMPDENLDPDIDMRMYLAKILEVAQAIKRQITQKSSKRQIEID